MNEGHVGFTGTQEGCTYAQLCALQDFLDDSLEFTHAHSGDCVGADTDFHGLARQCGFYTIGHPPIKQSKRAFLTYAVEREPGEYLERNKDIVNESALLIATPRGFEEELRSGTWSTIRYARSQNKPVVIIWPDGSFRIESNRKEEE